MNCLMRCPRAHFWQFEVGLRRSETGLALRIGSAWARAMEARWLGNDYDDALAAALPEGIDLDAYAAQTVAALLAGYYEFHGANEVAGTINPEVQFKSRLRGTGFTVEGKIDGVGSLKDGRSVLIEAKTTGDSLAPDSDYWLRLRFNLQVMQYVSESRKLGWDLSEVYYDVTRKPSIRPKSVDNLDEQGRKIVVDANGQRVFLKNGEPRLSGDKEKGYVVKSHVETPEEFGERLYQDTKARPDFYFARREVPIIDQEVEAFESQRLSLAKMIKHFRRQEKSEQRNANVWPRAVSEQTCGFCAYKDFCLQNISVDINQPPTGFSVQPFNPELQDESQIETTATA
jgi:hypothetical protein